MSVTVETISNLERRMTISLPVKPLEEEVSQHHQNGRVSAWKSAA
jgi:hypothetical protein